MKALEVLEAAKELLSSEDKWTQGALARDKNKEKVSEISPEADCWCLSGAVHRVCYRSPFIDTPCAVANSRAAALEVLYEYTTPAISNLAGYDREFFTAVSINDHDDINYSDIIAWIDMPSGV